MPPLAFCIGKVTGELNCHAAGVEAVGRSGKREDWMELQDSSVRENRKVWRHLEKSSERILDLKAAGHLVQHQSVNLLWIAHTKAPAFIGSSGQVDDARIDGSLGSAVFSRPVLIFRCEF